MKIRKFAASALCVCSFLTPFTMVNANPNSSSLSAVQTQSTQMEELKQHFNKGEFSHIVDVLAPLEKKTPGQYNMFVSALMNIDLDDAEEAAEKYINEHSDNFKAYHMHASVMGAQASSSIFSALGYAKKAKKSLEKAVEIAPDNVEVYQALMQFHMMAPSIAGGDMDEAALLAQKITELDEEDGQFAFAKLYLEDDKEKEAKALFASLIENESTQIRARMELGSFYLFDEQYAASYDTLAPLADIQLAPVPKTNAEAWKSYQESKSTLMYGTYRLGQLAVESGEYTEAGISALEGYLKEYATTEIDTENLPTPNWAQLRLAELFLNANNIDEAQRVVNSLTDEDDERFTKVLKKIKKALKKRAAV
ncbi:tetratricopeptide repeat protein [Alteromonas gracilis]|uniref:tetratricopeptide repeat protein n=1 Tax=Alteromonas gracilis TaxID=1479524 RepID=UPI0037361C9E